MSAVGDERLILLSGPSGAGKTSLAHHLLQRSPSLARVVSYTTRAPRPGERDGYDYHFVGEGEFEALGTRSDSVLDVTHVNSAKYWITSGSVQHILRHRQIPLLVVDPIGGRRISSERSVVSFFLLGSDMNDLRHRMTLRGDQKADVDARSALYDDEMSHAAFYGHLIESDRVSDQVDFVRGVLEIEFGERLQWILS